MTTLDRRIRHRVYQSLAESGSVPPRRELAASEGVTAEEVRASLERLAATHDVVLGPGDPGVVMAHPFSAVATDYRVTVEDRSWFANCAWDGLAILGLFGDGRVDTVSPLDRDPWSYSVEAGRVATAGLVYFPIPARSFWNDIGFTWANILAFRSEREVEEWTTREGMGPGWCASLQAVFDLSLDWYRGRLDVDWQRPDAAEATRRLAAHGFTGAFWELV